MAVGGSVVDFVYDRLVEAAIEGRRCPTSPELGKELALAGLARVPGNSVPHLARAGRIQIEVSGRNWRVVEIATGPHKGKRTAADPDGRKVRLIIRPGGEQIDLARQQAPGRGVRR